MLCDRGTYPDFNPRVHLTLVHQQLMHLARHRGAIVIWAGSHMTEQTLRRRLHWWLRDVPVTVIEVRVPGDDMATAAGTSVAMLDRAALRKALDNAVVLRAWERTPLAQEWVELREHGGGLRVWDNGRLVGRPAEHLDAQLLAMARSEPVPLPRLVGEAMDIIDRSDVFWRWRVRKLVALGRLQMVEGSPDEWQTVVVRSRA